MTIVHHGDLSKPGCWVYGRSRTQVLRDGADPSDPVRQLSPDRPTWFAKLCPAFVMSDPELRVDTSLPPPAEAAAGDDPAKRKK